MVKNTIERYVACQAVGRANAPEPIATTSMPKHPWKVLHVDFYRPLSSNDYLHTTSIPKHPWKVLHVDFYRPLPSNNYLLVVIDRYSGFPEVEVFSSTKASIVIPKLDKIFVVHGIPQILKSHNGPPFNGDDYNRYLRTLGIKPEFSIRLWPQGNAQVERFMQPLGKALKTAKIEGRPWKQELNRFLLQYRTTPHCTTSVPPAELLFNRTVKGKLPVLQRKNIVNRHKEARENEDKRQKYNKRYANERRNAKESEIGVGDHVLVKSTKSKQIDTEF